MHRHLQTSFLGQHLQLFGLAIMLVAVYQPWVDVPSIDCRGDHLPRAVVVRYRDGSHTSVQAMPFESHGLTAAIGVQRISVPMGQECAVAEVLRRDPHVAYAELDYAAHSADVITPTDAGWINQWGPAQVNAPTAWQITAGLSSVTIAVVDSGIQLNHEDLSSQLWTNRGEIPGNGVDDDGNGKIDDVHGWHFYQRWTGSTYVPAEDANVSDDYGHGTHVAGIAAAATNNGVGIAGMAGGARIMPVKVLDQFGNGWYSDIAAGIIYAADNGAQVINLSLGGTADSQLLRDAVDYARQRGALVIAATGNTGGAVLYPAAYEPVLAVAATDRSDQVAGFSNRGAQVDVAAPGVEIYSTWPWVGGYFTKSGTSMAAPHVAGMAALLRSERPDLSVDQIMQVITVTAHDVADLGWDQYSGWGRIDAAAAVSQVQLLHHLFLPLLIEQ
jgi:subtilisin family serine protease